LNIITIKGIGAHLSMGSPCAPNYISGIFHLMWAGQYEKCNVL